MKIDINKAQPQLMHIDLNSAFAMIEQQANPFLRGKPVSVTNRLSRGATIIAASYEAKRLGIGVGTKMSEASQLAPKGVVLETDPPKYIYAHRVFKSIIEDYSPNAFMKSIDEGIIDFKNLHPSLRQGLSLTSVAEEIKSRMKQSLGQWITCNIGIAPNRFLAKLAAGLNKPDGLDVIDHRNLKETLKRLALTDLPGINYRFEARLNAAGIFNPLEFLGAGEQLLSRQVFKSINGHLWYMRLRGWEVDDYPTQIRTVGKQYVLHEWTADRRQLAVILMKMCEMLGRRLRGKGLCARGVFIGCWFTSHQYWYTRKKFKTRLYTTQEIFTKALQLLNQRPCGLTVKALSVTAYGLSPAKTNQASLFETDDMKHWQLSDVVDSVNDRFGEFSVMPAAMANTAHLVPDKIPFGGTRYFK